MTAWGSTKVRCITTGGFAENDENDASCRGTFFVVGGWLLIILGGDVVMAIIVIIIFRKNREQK